MLVKVSTKTAQAKMIEPAAKAFEQLRETVRKGSGIDFLAKCADVYRSPNFKSSKDGVADRSWHKTGRAFDYDQTSNALVIVSEPIGGRQFFRTYLKCTNQSGVQGVKRKVRDMRGYYVDAYLFDFTTAAEAANFERIPAWSGWQKNYNRREFWHYQYNPENLTWAAAMDQVNKTTKAPTHSGELVLGLNDRGEEVKKVQAKLVELKFLPSKEIDGIFGAKTDAAVKKFQKAYKLDVDGKVGPKTRRALGL